MQIQASVPEISASMGQHTLVASAELEIICLHITHYEGLLATIVDGDLKTDTGACRKSGGWLGASYQFVVVGYLRGAWGTEDSFY